MGVRLKQNISVLNVQQWMLKKNLAKKKNNYKGLLLTVIVILTVSLLVGFVKYTQSNRVAMHDEVLIQQYSFPFIQALAI